MKAKMKMILVVCGVVLFVAGAARPKDKTDGSRVRQIIVQLHRSSYSEVLTFASSGFRAGGRLVYDTRTYALKKVDISRWLAEAKLREGNDCQIVPIIDDNVELGAVTQIYEMAINAGFTDVHPFLYSRKTGRMAELQVGRPMKFTINPEEIERKLERP